MPFASRNVWQGLALVAMLGFAWSVGAEVPAANKERTMAFSVTSPAFQESEGIPSQYTCDGQNVSPALQWTPPPPGTKSLALISDDSDAPGGVWVHWVVYNLPPSEPALHEAFPPDDELPDGTRQGLTDFGRTGYGGPCPPDGTHRYVFTLYALDTLLALPPRATAKALKQAMAGHVVAQAQLMGTYRRRSH